MKLFSEGHGADKFFSKFFWMKMSIQNLLKVSHLFYKVPESLDASSQSGSTTWLFSFYVGGLCYPVYQRGADNP